MTEDGSSSFRSFWQFQGADSYIDSLFLMGSPFPVLLIWASYMFFVLKLGPKLMENRPAYKLKTLLLVYNVSQVAVSCTLFLKGLSAFNDYGLLEKGYCFLELGDQDKMRLYDGGYLYLMVKVTEFLDTIFFVLRKKKSQVTFLHVYHHSLMCLGSWIVLKYEPTYSLAFVATINSFVHVIMYAYYGLAAFPRLAKHLWWKKYITKLQLVQFVSAGIYSILNSNVTTCPVSVILLSAIAVNLVLFIYLFTDFYIKRYSDVKTNNENELKKQ